MNETSNSQAKSPQENLFQARLDQQLDPKHPLFRLAQQIDWSYFEREFGAFTRRRWAAGEPTRLLVGLHYLKHAYNESDESVVESGLGTCATENPIQPSDACTYKNYPLILPIGIRNSVFLILLPLYGSLPFSPSPCTLLFCASIGTDGGNPRPSPATGNPQPHSQTAFLTISRSVVLDRLIAILEWLALRPADRQTGDCHQMASPRVSALLGLEIESWSPGTTKN